MPTHLQLARAKSVLERRLFLKALGLGLAAPLAFRLSKSATAATTGAPKRLFVMYFPHGIAPEHFNPLMAGDGKDPTQFALDQTNESILGPLEPYKKWVNVYNGFEYPGEYGTHEGCVNVLSGANTGDETTPRTTLDQVIAKGMGSKSLVLGACSHQTFGIDLHGKMFWDGTAIDPQKSPVAAADKLFGGLGNPSPTVSADEQLRSALVDLTSTEIQDLKTTVAGLTREESKLATHLAAVQALKEDSGGAVSSCTSMPSLPTVDKVRKESAGLVVQPGGGNDYFYQEANFRTLFQAQLELTAQALICNAASVISLMPMYPTAEFDFSFIGGAAGAGGWGHHNGLSHTFPQQEDGVQYNSPVSVNNLKPAVRATFARAQRWFFEQLTTNVVSLLATTPDPSASDGSMVLDNTMIFCFSEIGDGANHLRVSEIMYPQVPEYLPFVTIGGAGKGLKTGQVISLPIMAADSNAKARPATDLYLTLAKAMGVDATFPATTGIVEGVLA